MLNPRVGDILDISSPTSRLRIVVFPALSSPLDHELMPRLGDTIEGMVDNGRDMEGEEEVDVQEKNPHFLRFRFILSNDRQQTYTCQPVICRRSGMLTHIDLFCSLTEVGRESED
jgi:hypothetical protein